MPLVCEDFNDCTVDSCQEGSGCVFIEIPGCGILPPDTETIYNDTAVVIPPLPSQSPLPAPPDAAPTATSTPQSFQVVQQVVAPSVAAAPPDNDNNEPPPGESNNEVVAQSSISYGGALIGLIFVSCAGFCAMVFGILATKDASKDQDRLDIVLDNEEDILSAPVENEAFQSDSAV